MFKIAVYEQQHLLEPQRNMDHREMDSWRMDRRRDVDCRDMDGRRLDRGDVDTQ